MSSEIQWLISSAPFWFLLGIGIGYTFKICEDFVNHKRHRR